MIFLRKVSVGDAAVLSEIHQESFSEWWSVSSFNSMLRDPSFFGFIVGQELKAQKSNAKQVIECGFILCRRAWDEVEIITFAVRPQYRRRNFGKLLMVEVIKQSGVFLQETSPHLENMKIFLEVSTNNTAAINLYRSFGFEKISKRIKYYKDQKGEEVDANVMALIVASKEG